MHKNGVEESFYGGGKKDNEDCGNMGRAAYQTPLFRPLQLSSRGEDHG